MGAIVRGKINRGDLALFDGKNSTSSRATAAGGTVSGLVLNDFVDLLQVFGGGTAKTSGTVNTAIGFVGTSTCTFMFGPGAWNFTADVTIPATTVEAALQELGATTGAAIIGLADSGGNYTAANVEAALAELASVATGEGASIIGVEDSAGNFAAVEVEAALAELQTNIDAVYTSGSFTATLTGCTTSPQDTWYWILIGNVVHLWTSDNNSFAGTSNATTMTMTGLPAGITPSVNTAALCRVTDNSQNKSGMAFIQSDSQFLFLVDDPLSSTGFTASGTKGFYGMVTYSLMGAHV